MQLISEALERTIEELAKLPGMGRKSAQRIAMHLLKKDEGSVLKLAETLVHLKQSTTTCSVCHIVTDRDPCPICGNPKRNTGIVCVVEDIKDVYAIERTNEFKGRYHVLGGVISPMESIGPDQIRIKELVQRVGSGEIEELILALNPDAEGEATSFYIQKLVRPFEIKITRIAQGIPLGSELEFVDEATLSRAFEGRSVV
ncbi:recombination protein RecR [bacterium]|nr:MAG: recombination protein RecR [bacterium]